MNKFFPSPPPPFDASPGSGSGGDGRFGGFYRRLEKHEGRAFTDDPDDPGGPTKIGVTQDTLAAYLAWKREGGQAVDIPADVRDLEPEDAARIYREFYYERYRIGEIADPDMAEHLLDVAVNPGPSRSARWAQEAANQVAGAGLAEDGVMGSRTIAALNELSPEERRRVTNAIADRREAEYRGLVAENLKKRKYLSGWLARAGSFRR